MDACLEMACLTMSLAMKATVRVYSASMQVDYATQAKNRIQRSLLLDWKNSEWKLLPEQLRQFSADLPVDQALKYGPPANIAELGALQLDGNGQAVILEDVKRRWRNHVVYGAEWVAELAKLEE